VAVKAEKRKGGSGKTDYRNPGASIRMPIIPVRSISSSL
jgi:hypothetical protein